MKTFNGWALTLTFLLGGAFPLQAELTLTAAGSGQGFTLSTFASGFPTVDSGVPGYADGTFNQYIASVSAVPDSAAGIATSPVNGHLFVSVEDPAHPQVVDVDPIAKTVTPFVDTVQSPDGMAFNASGSILYVSILDQFLPGRVLGFDTATKAQVFDSGVITGGPDGLALGTGALAGNLFVNTNDGRVVEINLATNLQTEIASGGSRGDFVKVDPNNGTLLLIQSDSIVRLTPPAGGGFEGAVPEPSSLTIFGLFALGFAGYSIRRRRIS